MGDYGIMYKLSTLLGTDEYTLTYQLIEFLGLLNVVLVIAAGSLFLLRRLNRRMYANKNATLQKLIKPLSKIHPYIGIILIISALIHGTLALGTIFTLHTGTLAWWIVFVMMLVALFGKQYRIKNWLKVHRSLAVLFIISVLLHLSVRNLL